MNERMMHPDPERLEAYAEGELQPGDTAALESHLTGCVRCQAEVGELRTLFASLAALPQHSPSPGFAVRVMAGVRVPVPWGKRIAGWIDLVLPGTPRGWLLAAAFAAVPVVAGGAAIFWLLSLPGLSAGTLWTFAQQQTLVGLVWLADRAGAAVFESAFAAWLTDAVGRVVGGAGAVELGLGLVAFSMSIIASMWVLYQNLFRSPRRDGGSHAPHRV